MTNLLWICLLVPVLGALAETTRNPGFKARITQKGLDYGI